MTCFVPVSVGKLSFSVSTCPPSKLHICQKSFRPNNAISHSFRRSIVVSQSNDSEPTPVLKPPPKLVAPSPPSAPSSPVEESVQTVNVIEEKQVELEKPRDPSELRTESERRRNSPVHTVRRRRRRRKLISDELGDWDAMESRPLVQKPVDPATGEDYWIEMKPKAPKPKRKPKIVDSNVKEKLRKETVEPYKSNWIGIIVLVVLVLIILYNVLPNEAPMIRIPDL
uniref:Uncharacterized protein n=1 Tax=Timspurckia oligopyrenoides TaxID=708627 RepID=A0A7S0ZAQ5_9RHOD|mmetsp:Transcript_1039/g.1968  ORF Transcript_1039/g.1968 Transcript_1039/m.1968 type:complete len:226 (+) Transcript_1039:293-970(+)|eukprot:CAMPEP_0182444066 /NCGR_PEP_ID=MMETSP1172-20130603/2631_1 /TAXON_ID=708627 /ORGANISM="Timspurckia oligopyrenoides, Strain CCMP3278" /LENGTH=225 /DNA_ID=CAMNT_0024639529 /DNA_START=249 /DNA_END=926 /DNA_ORIENTATION=+